MSGATALAVQLKKDFPGLRVTSVVRSQAEQDALVKAGKTRARNSQHLSDSGLDIVLPKGVTSEQVRKYLSDKGIEPGEFLNESGNGPNQGTGAHLHIGLDPKGGDPASAAGGSTFDRVSARQRASGPSLTATYEAYKNGQMSPQEAAQFENGVLTGHIILPRGAKINKTAPVPTLPKELIDAYNSGEMENDPEARAEIDRAIHAGEVSLPRGVQLKQPKPRTAVEQYTLGAAALGRGMMAPMDILAGPVNAVVNKVLGTKLSATPFQDMQMRPLPRNDRERMLVAGMEGAGSAVPTLPLGGGSVAAAALDTLSGATSGVAQETARQAGAGPGGQFLAGLAGGLAPVGAMGAVERAATRTPKTLETTVAETPRAAVVDQNGELTPHGQEIAARHSVTPEEVVRAYEAPPAARAGVANDEAPLDLAKAKEGTTNQVPGDEGPDARPIPVRPVEEAAPTPQAASPEAPEALPETALARVQEGKDFGIDYSRGQATKNFDIQDAEQRLKASNGPEAEQMRQFVAKQQEQVKTAVDEFRSAFDNPDETAATRGAKVQEAVRSLRDLGKEGVTALYKQARDLGEPVPLEAEPIRQAYQRVMVEANVPDSAKAELTQEMARYGLIGKVEKSNGVTTGENGITTVRLDNGQKVQFYGQPETLQLDNAEALRKVVSDLYRTDGPRKLTQIVKRAIDDAVESAAVKVAGGKEGSMSEAMAKARDAHIAQTKAFKGGDVVQAIADWKKGQEGVTSRLNPEQVMSQTLGSTSNLKRVKAILLSKPTIESKTAWNTIQAHGLATIFEKATTRNTNIGGEITDAISGAKLRSEVERFGVDKLKVLLEKEDFNRLMRLRRVIEDVTIPITGTTNPSGSGNLLMRLSASVVGRIPLGGGMIARVSEPVAHLWKRAKEIAEAKEVAAGTNYTPEKAATETAKAGEAVKKPGVASRAADKAGDFTKAFIDIYSTPRVIAPVLAATSGEEK